MTDRELLELAAKTAGIDLVFKDFGDGDEPVYLQEGRAGTPGYVSWNPINNDGDALRLAVTIKLSVKHGVEIWDDTNSMSAYAYYGDVGECQFEPHGDNPSAATRRAIVRAAAAIGEAMP